MSLSPIFTPIFLKMWIPNVLDLFHWLKQVCQPLLDSGSSENLPSIAFQFLSNVQLIIVYTFHNGNICLQIFKIVYQMPFVKAIMIALIFDSVFISFSFHSVQLNHFCFVQFLCSVKKVFWDTILSGNSRSCG